MTKSQTFCYESSSWSPCVACLSAGHRYTPGSDCLGPRACAWSCWADFLPARAPGCGPSRNARGLLRLRVPCRLGAVRVGTVNSCQSGACVMVFYCRLSVFLPLWRSRGIPGTDPRGRTAGEVVGKFQEMWALHSTCQFAPRSSWPYRPRTQRGPPVGAQLQWGGLLDSLQHTSEFKKMLLLGDSEAFSSVCVSVGGVSLESYFCPLPEEMNKQRYWGSQSPENSCSHWSQRLPGGKPLEVLSPHLWCCKSPGPSRWGHRRNHRLAWNTGRVWATLTPTAQLSPKGWASEQKTSEEALRLLSWQGPAKRKQTLLNHPQ